MSQAEELRHQASSSSHEVDQDQEEEGQLGDQMEEVSNKTLLRLLSNLKKLFSKHMVTLQIMIF